MNPATEPSTPPEGAASTIDDRRSEVGRLTALGRRPEVGAAIAVVVVAVFFAFQSSTFMTLSGISNWTDVASTIAIPAVAVSLLMIGGEFDLSAGVMTGTAGLTMGVLGTEVGLNIWLCIALTLMLAAAIGFFNGYMVYRTQLPSFIVTLATFFMLQGINLGVTKAIIGGVIVGGISDVPGFSLAHDIFAGTFWSPHDFQVSLIWWIALAAIGSWVLTRTRIGNWIFAVGGDADAARNTGVPVSRVKIGLFMTTSLLAALTGIIIALRLGSMQASQGVGEEFTYIIVAVVGGCLLTGGFGSVIGSSLGALIVGMAFIGIQFAGWNTDWRYLFLGVILLIAVLVNNYIRKAAEGAKS